MLIRITVVEGCESGKIFLSQRDRGDDSLVAVKQHYRTVKAISEWFLIGNADKTELW